MPRLLLVDDNQRIHQIVETLLAATDIELTCVASAAEALERIAAGPAFDVALLDTTMAGIDGWELLDKLRADPACAQMPIAMMAGVLDVVDPDTVANAPIQGFLKKPVELRDLAERVRTFLATPVPPPRPRPEVMAPDTFATMPYLKLADHPLPAEDLLLLEAGDLAPEPEALPEPAFEAAFQPEPEPAAAPVPEPALQPEPEATAEPVAEPAFEAQFDSLELEELDLESLKGLNLAAEPVPVPSTEDVPTVEDLAALPDLAPEDAFAGEVLDLGVSADDLPDLGPEPSEEATQALPIQPGLLVPPPEGSIAFDWSDESETLLEAAGALAPPVPAAEPEPAAAAAMDTHDDFDTDSFLDADPGPQPTPAFLPEIPEYATPVRFTELSEAEMMADLPVAEAPEAPEPPAETAGAAVPPWAPTLNLAEPAPAPEPAAPAAVPAVQEITADPLAALLSDPVLMDRLAKAVVARLGDKVLREIAWEVMPEMADRLHRN